jgi:hypothetical protein
MNAKREVAIVIPIYKADLNLLEEISLKQCFLTLHKYPVVAIAPQSLDLSNIWKYGRFETIERFDDSFFESVQHYNALMLSPHFYERFLNYEFILIHQLDAFVFSDQLADWCNTDLDYVGAPWLKRIEVNGLNEVTATFKTWFYTFFNISKYGVPSDRQFDNVVGNGGFSLRRVERFYKLATSCKSKMRPYVERTEFKFHEDVFWSIEVNRRKTRLRIPDYRTAVQFAFENYPERCLQLNDNKLPFGCHAWDLHIEFWKAYFKKFDFYIDQSIVR